MRTLVSILAFVTLASSVTAAPAGLPLRVGAWNLESGGAEILHLAGIADEIKDVDVWGFSEVQDLSWTRTMQASAERASTGSDNFGIVQGTTGKSDQMSVVFDEDKLRAIQKFELHNINPGNRVRSPLVVHLQDRKTLKKFAFVVNHLYRGNDSARHQQAKDLNRWASKQTIPVIMVGDFNFDWHFKNGETDHDLGYNHLVEADILKWVRPAKFVPTNGSSHQSILDFVFVSPGSIQGTSSIVETSFSPDDRENSDHRPITADLTIQ